MRGASRVLLALVAIATGSVRADRPWNEKAYGDWDRTDVHRILFASPWVRHFTRAKRPLEFELPDQGPSGMELRGYHAKESTQDGAENCRLRHSWVSRAHCARHRLEGWPYSNQFDRMRRRQTAESLSMSSRLPSPDPT